MHQSVHLNFDDQASGCGGGAETVTGPLAATSTQQSRAVLAGGAHDKSRPKDLKGLKSDSEASSEVMLVMHALKY